MKELFRITRTSSRRWTVTWSGRLWREGRLERIQSRNNRGKRANRRRSTTTTTTTTIVALQLLSSPQSQASRWFWCWLGLSRWFSLETPSSDAGSTRSLLNKSSTIRPTSRTNNVLHQSQISCKTDKPNHYASYVHLHFWIREPIMLLTCNYWKYTSEFRVNNQNDRNVRSFD